MSSYLDYHCPTCAFTARIGGPAEFYLSGDGVRRRYGHPEPIDAEAAKRGVDGFWMELWCNGCGAVKQVVTMEFTAPCDPLDAWVGRAQPQPGYPDDAENCPDCGSTLLDELPGAPALCPACGQAAIDHGVRRL